LHLFNRFLSLVPLFLIFFAFLLQFRLLYSQFMQAFNDLFGLFTLDLRFDLLELLALFSERHIFARHFLKGTGCLIGTSPQIADLFALFLRFSLVLPLILLLLGKNFAHFELFSPILLYLELELLSKLEILVTQMIFLLLQGRVLLLQRPESCGYCLRVLGVREVTGLLEGA